MSEIKNLYTKRVIDNRNVKMVDAIKELLGKADVNQSSFKLLLANVVIYHH